MRDRCWERKGGERQTARGWREGKRGTGFRVGGFRPLSSAEPLISPVLGADAQIHQRSVRTAFLSGGLEDGGRDVDGVCAGYVGLSGKEKK